MPILCLFNNPEQFLLPHEFGASDLREIESIIAAVVTPALEQYYCNSTASYKQDGSIITEADLTIHNKLGAALTSHYPGIALLSEESPIEEQQQAIESDTDYWCLDPLDGTTNFHATFPCFSLALALVRDGKVVLGIVYDPTRQEFFSALRGGGLYLNGSPAIKPKQPEQLGRAVAFIDFKRLKPELRSSLVLQPPFKSQRNIGSSALEWAWLAAGRANLLLHGGQKPWDCAAGSLLLEEAEGVCTTIDGKSIFDRSLGSRSVLAATTPALYEQWSKLVKINNP